MNHDMPARFAAIGVRRGRSSRFNVWSMPLFIRAKRQHVRVLHFENEEKSHFNILSEKPQSVTQLACSTRSTRRICRGKWRWDKFSCLCTPPWVAIGPPMWTFRAKSAMERRRERIRERNAKRESARRAPSSSSSSGQRAEIFYHEPQISARGKLHLHQRLSRRTCSIAVHFHLL